MKKDNPLKRFIRLLIDNKWFFTCTASGMATIIGISLTFGLNSCREKQRRHKESVMLIERTIVNIENRAKKVNAAINILTDYGKTLNTICEDYQADPQSIVSDSVVDKFVDAIGTSWFFVNDRSVEQIFLNSYESWNVIGDLATAERIGLCFDQLNYLEGECYRLFDNMDNVVRNCNTSKGIMDMDRADFVKALIEDRDFRFTLMQHELKTESLEVTFGQLTENIDYLKENKPYRE